MKERIVVELMIEKSNWIENWALVEKIKSQLGFAMASCGSKLIDISVSSHRIESRDLKTIKPEC